MKAGSLLDIYACVPEYCIDADDQDAVTADGTQQAPMILAPSFWTRWLTGTLFESPA